MERIFMNVFPIPIPFPNQINSISIKSLKRLHAIKIYLPYIINARESLLNTKLPFWNLENGGFPRHFIQIQQDFLLI